MPNLKLLMTASVVFMLQGCATQPEQRFAPPRDYIPVDQIQISNEFNTIELSQDSVASEINHCVPQLNAKSESLKRDLAKFPNKNITLFGHVSSANQFWIKESTGICLHRSSNKYPILAAEAFFMTANPVGVPPDVSDNWYKQIALLIATKGKAKVAYRYKNGNAFIADYWVEQRQGHKLYYASSFKKQGEWESLSIDLQLSHDYLSSVSETKRDGRAEKPNLLSHRLP